jgi:hypothetical protein
MAKRELFASYDDDDDNNDDKDEEKENDEVMVRGKQLTFSSKYYYCKSVCGISVHHYFSVFNDAVI